MKFSGAHNHDGMHALEHAQAEELRTTLGRKTQRAQGTTGTQAAKVQETAEQFEALLLTELFKVMRKTAPNSGLMGGSGMGRDIYTAMLDEELAKASVGQLGIGDAILRQLQPEQHGRMAQAPIPMSIQNLLNDGSWVSPLEKTPHKLSAGQMFGAERPGDRPDECGAGHCGIDLAGEQGTPVRSVRDGEVVRVQRDPHAPGGLGVTVRHGPLTSLYLHLDHIAEGLKVGSAVQAGQALGEVGSTGPHSTGPHLHFELSYRTQQQNRRIDPQPYLGVWGQSEEE